MNDRNRRAITLLCFFSALICFIISGVSAYRTNSFLKTALRTEGLVTEMVAVSGENGVTYAPVYSFADGKGVSRTGRSGHSSNPPSYKEGDTLAILYNPQDPDSNRPGDFFSLWGISPIAAIVAMLNSLMGLGFHFWPRLQQGLGRLSKTGG